MRVLIADDEPVARQVLREHLETMPSIEIAGEASNGNEAAQRIFELNPDLVLLDQQMPEMDGLSLVRHLRTHMPLVIFVTAFEQHAIDAFDVGAVDYLLKPVRRERLERALEKARRQMRSIETIPSQNPAQSGVPNLVQSGPQPAAPSTTRPALGAALKKITGRRGADLYLLDPAEIIAFQAEGELVHIVTAQQKYLAEAPLKELERDPALASFRRVHRATLINADHIRKISPLSSRRWMLKMSNGFEAIVSKRLAKALRE